MTGGASVGKPGAAGSSGGYGFPSNSRRTYEECDTMYEMKNDVSISGGPDSGSHGGVSGRVGGGSGYLNFDTTATTKSATVRSNVRQGRRNSTDDEDDFDAGSQKRIIIQRPHGGGGSRDLSGGIMVTKQIALSRDD